MTRFKPGSSRPRSLRKSARSASSSCEISASMAAHTATTTAPSPLARATTASRCLLLVKPSSLTLATYMTGLSVGLLFLRQAHGAHRLALVEVLAHALEQLLLSRRILVATLGLLGITVRGLFHGLQIREAEFGVDDLDVTDRVDAARHVHHVRILEAAHHVRDRIGLAN